MISASDTHNDNDATVAQPSFSFPREHRLHLQRQFAHVFRQGTRQRGRLLTVVASRSGEEEGFKAGFVARKKIFKRAVDRNRVKRRMRELVRLNRQGLRADIWIVVMAEAGALTATWESLSTEFKHLCQKAGIDKG